MNKKGIITSIILVIGLTIIAVILTTNTIKNKELPEKEVEFIGIIKDFEITVGGFLHPDIAKVELTNGKIVVIRGSIIGKLETGKGLYVITKRGAFTTETWEIRELHLK